MGSRWLLRKSTFPEGRGPVLKDLPAPPFWEGEAPAELAHLWEGEAPAVPNTHRTPLWEGEAPAEPAHLWEGEAPAEPDVSAQCSVIAKPAPVGSFALLGSQSTPLAMQSAVAHRISR